MSFAPNPEQFMLAESVPPAQLVGQRVWVEGYGPGCVLKFEKAAFGFGTSTHTIRFDSGQEEKVKLRRHANGKTPFILLDPQSLIRPSSIHRYADEDSGSEPVTPSEGSFTHTDASIDGSVDIPGKATEPMDCAMPPGSLIEHLEHHAWENCARIAQPGYSSSALSESLSESPSCAFSLTPPDSIRFEASFERGGGASGQYNNSTSKPVAIPAKNCEVDHDADQEICRVDHLLSESGTIFTPGEHKWICEASPPANPILAAMMSGGAPPPQTQDACAQ